MNHPNPQPRAIPEIPALPWIVWRIYQGQRSESGSFASQAEAERARRHLSRAMPRFRFEIEFVGKAEFHESGL